MKTLRNAKTKTVVGVSAAVLIVSGAGAAVAADHISAGNKYVTESGKEIARTPATASLTEATAAHTAAVAKAEETQQVASRATPRSATGACVNKRTGVVRVGRCSGRERRMVLSAGDIRTSSTLYEVVSPMYTVLPESYMDYVATCNRGGKAVSGSFYQAEVALAYLNESYQPSNLAQWKYSFTNASSTFTTYPFYVTICAR